MALGRGRQRAGRKQWLSSVGGGAAAVQRRAQLAACVFFLCALSRRTRQSGADLTTTKRRSGAQKWAEFSLVAPAVSLRATEPWPPLSLARSPALRRPAHWRANDGEQVECEFDRISRGRILHPKEIGPDENNATSLRGASAFALAWPRPSDFSHTAAAAAATKLRRAEPNRVELSRAEPG